MIRKLIKFIISQCLRGIVSRVVAVVSCVVKCGPRRWKHAIELCKAAHLQSLDKCESKQGEIEEGDEKNGERQDVDHARESIDASLVPTGNAHGQFYGVVGLFAWEQGLRQAGESFIPRYFHEGDE